MENSIMRKLVMILIFGLISIVLAAPTVTIFPNNEKLLKKTTMRTVLVHWDDDVCFDVNDVNVSAGNIYGNLLTWRIDSTGTDANYYVSFSIDPPEDVEVAKLYEITALGTGVTSGVFYAPDPNYGGMPIAGKFYVGLSEAYEPNIAIDHLSDIKVWITYDEKAPSSK
jgi:hypothetical protein